MMATRTFVAGLLELRQIPFWIRSMLSSETNLLPSQISALMMRVELAVQELCVNVVTHAYAGRPGQRLSLEIELDGQEFSVVVVDDGPEFDPLAVPAPDPGSIQVHGFGVSIISSLTTEFVVTRVDGRNRSRLVFAVPPRADEYGDTEAKQ
jgi:anti-sigma regulatory factor (Ser/Thr protein kinase)